MPEPRSTPVPAAEAFGAAVCSSAAERLLRAGSPRWGLRSDGPVPVGGYAPDGHGSVPSGAWCVSGAAACVGSVVAVEPGLSVNLLRCLDG